MTTVEDILHRWGPGTMWAIHTEDGDLDGYVRAADHTAAMAAAAEMGCEGDYTCEEVPEDGVGTEDERNSHAREDVRWLLDLRAIVESDLATARAEAKRERERRASCEAWYAVRIEHIRVAAEEHGVWPLVAAIIANESEGPHDPPTFSRLLVWATHRADTAERTLEAIRTRTRDACAGTGLSPANAETVPEIVRILVDRLAAMEAERDAYKRAKRENDERYMIERDDARRERDAALARVRELEATIAALRGGGQ